jgi:dTDP-L-rhamnose 4-epimerase
MTNVGNLFNNLNIKIMEIKHILITGGAGFIGSNLANFLVSKGHNIRVFDNLSPQIHGVDSQNSYLFKSLNKNIEFIKGSITNRNELISALEGIDSIVHFAAETGTGQSMYNIQHYSDVNINGTAILLDLIANNQTNVKKIIIASSRAVYGEGKYNCSNHGFVYPNSRLDEDMKKGDFFVRCPFCGNPSEFVITDEESPIKPTSFYGITKSTQEQMVLTVGKAIGIPVIAFRYQNVYGPGQSLSNPYTGILSIFSTRIRNHSSINIFEDGLESRDFVYIDDVVNITAKAIEIDEPIFDVFNVGSGISTNVLNVAEALSSHLDIKVPIKISGNYRIGDIRHNVADLKKAKKIFDFEPKFFFEDGLAKFVKWVKNEEIQIDSYENSLKELKLKGLLK